MNLSASQAAAIEVTASPALAGYPPGACYGPRTLADFELVWLVAGSARWRSVGGGRGSPVPRLATCSISGRATCC